MEYFDLYDKFGQMLNKKVLRGTRLEDGEFHLVVNIWIRNKNGEYLIQQRNKLTDRTPFMWATTAGSAVSGDTSIETAVKETHEEIGALLKKENLKLLKRYFVEDNFASYILDVYLIEADILLKDLKIDIEEVKDVKYSTMKDIHKQIALKSFVDYEYYVKEKGYFDLIEKS